MKAWMVKYRNLVSGDISSGIVYADDLATAKNKAEQDGQTKSGGGVMLEVLSCHEILM